MKPSVAYIPTYSGGRFRLFSPHRGDITIEDIAHGLSLLCRFSGQIREFYSVAQHSELVSRLCAPQHALRGLLHDASEAFLVDIPRPLKSHRQFGFYRRTESAAMRAICNTFGVPARQPLSVTLADNTALATEARDLLTHYESGDWRWLPAPLPKKIVPLSPRDAESAFLARFYELQQRVAA